MRALCEKNFLIELMMCCVWALFFGQEVQAAVQHSQWRLDLPTAYYLTHSEDSMRSDVGPLPEREDVIDSIYNRPYSLDENKINEKMLWRNSASLVGIGFGTMGFLYLMPSSFTNWDDDDDEGPFEKWWDNVSQAPVWDEDDLFLNYVTHPYAGAIYYMGARSAGANAGYSFLYSFAMSTFFWEYGIESFAERPSIQDLIITPVAGALLGEWFYKTKRSILENNKELCGSKALGTAALVLMDPITEVSEWFWDDELKAHAVTFSSQPMMTPSQHFGYGLSVQFQF